MPRNKLTDFDLKLRDQISENLKRYSNNMTQAQLSDKTGIPVSTLSGYFSKRSTPNPGAVQKIANALKVDKSDIDPRFQNDINTSIEQKNASLIKPNFNTYNYFDAGLSAGVLLDVDPFTQDDIQQIALSDELMGPYAGDKDLFVTHINGESMNHVLPNGSMVAIKEYSSIHNLKDGDIVVFQDGGEMSVKRFYNDPATKIVTFMPDSTDSSYRPINYRYEDINGLRIIGKVVVYSVILC